MYLSVATGVRTGKPRVLAPRRGAALLGVFAILLQAVLFGWHNHPLPLSPRGAPAVLAAGPAPGHEAPGLADDDCQICFALSHHSATPIDFLAAPIRGHVPLPPQGIAAVRVPAAPYILFRSRAPPRA